MQDPYKHTLVLISVMLLMGMLGGFVNFFITKSDDPQGSNIKKSLVVSTGASFLVPLFLNMISSNLIEATRTDAYKVLVFAGFCLVAAISSAAFIRTLSDRILSEARAARKTATEAKLEAEQAKEDVLEVQAVIDPIVEKGTEPEPLPAEPPMNSSEREPTPTRSVLKSIAQNKYAYRTLSGISKETRLPKEQVLSILTDLFAQGLLGEKVGKKGNRLWFVTEQGLEALQRQ